MRPNHLSTAKAFAGSGAQLGYGREGRENTVHATPSAHEPATTAVLISAGEQAPAETLKLSQRRLVLLLLLWWRVNCLPGESGLGVGRRGLWHSLGW